MIDKPRTESADTLPLMSRRPLSQQQLLALRRQNAEVLQKMEQVDAAVRAVSFKMVEVKQVTDR